VVEAAAAISKWRGSFHPETHPYTITGTAWRKGQAVPAFYVGSSVSGMYSIKSPG
jgi:hypothetical protein